MLAMHVLLSIDCDNNTCMVHEQGRPCLVASASPSGSNHRHPFAQAIFWSVNIVMYEADLCLWQYMIPYHTVHNMFHCTTLHVRTLHARVWQVAFYYYLRRYNIVAKVGERGNAKQVAQHLYQKTRMVSLQDAYLYFINDHKMMMILQGNQKGVLKQAVQHLY